MTVSKPEPLLFKIALDCIDALNNIISGIYAFAHKSIPPAISCPLNGMVGQVTVQVGTLRSSY